MACVRDLEILGSISVKSFVAYIPSMGPHLPNAVIMLNAMTQLKPLKCLAVRRQIEISRQVF